jgi:hypothetical protein
MRDHDVTTLTGPELNHALRELAASLSLTRPGSPARVPIRARLSPIDGLARRAVGEPHQHQGSPLP